MRKNFIFLLSFALLANFLMQGCTTLPNKPYLKHDTAGIEPLKLVRHSTPPLRAYRTGNMVASMAVSGFLFGGFGAAFGYAIHHALTIESDNSNVPDFGKLLVGQFSERVKKEIPQWPSMSIVEEPVQDGYLNDNSSYIVEINIVDIRIEMNSGVVVESIIVMKDRSNNIIWEKGYRYDALYFERIKSYDMLMRNDCRGLKKEFEFAAEKTVSDFIAHFNNSLNHDKAMHQIVPELTTGSDKPSQKPENRVDLSIETDQRYKEIKAIVLEDGDVIEGQIISLNAETVKIRTKEGKVLSFSFIKEVKTFIKE